jgi:hypothetical protein
VWAVLFAVPAFALPSACHGGEGDRTPDLVNAIHALSQLSYAPRRTAEMKGHRPPFRNREDYSGVPPKSSKSHWRNTLRSLFCSTFFYHQSCNAGAFAGHS